MLLTRPPLKSEEASFFIIPLDLHVLGTPPAFVLSQDQTLHKVFDLLVVVTEVTIDEACASFMFVFRRIRFLPHRSVFKVQCISYENNGREDRIRTCDPLVPNQVLYQAELLPEKCTLRDSNSRPLDS